MEVEPTYELVYIVRPDLPEDGVKKINEKMEGILAKHKAKLLELKDLGTKIMAYRIEKQTKGRYFQCVFGGSGPAVEELERNLRLTEQVMRFLTVRRPKVSAKYPPLAPRKEGGFHEV